MMILMYVLGVLIVMALVMGIRKADEIEMGIDLSHPAHNSFEFGITNRNYTWDNGDEQQELRIGFVVIIFSISFYKNNA